VAGEGDELEVRLGDGPLHLAHLYEGDKRVLEAVHEQDGDRDSTVEGGVSFWPMLPVHYVLQHISRDVECLWKLDRPAPDT